MEKRPCPKFFGSSDKHENPMKLSTPSLLNFSLILKSVKDAKRETFILGGMTLMALFQVILIGWALYVFAAKILKERAPTVGPVRDIVLSGEDIKKVVGLLDERAEKFKKILEAE